jgi:hypothetical protein
MNRRQKLNEKVGDWLLEASVLVAVLPLVEQLVATGKLSLPLTLGAVATALIFLSVGLYLAIRS